VDDSNCFFVVLQGYIVVLNRSKSGLDSRFAVLGPGFWFGVMGFMEGMPGSASVVTVSPARFFNITSADLHRLYRFDMKSYSLIVLNIAREMSRRLRVADGILADLIANVVDGYGRGPRKGSA
jgi:CRP-like cAMP-binding protein